MMRKENTKNARKAISPNTRKLVFERDEYKCRYCGDEATCIDHIIPYSFLHDNTINNLVSACTWCNMKAHALIFESFEFKSDYLKESFTRKFRNLVVPIWLEDELSDIGYSLATKIRKTSVVCSCEEEADRVFTKLSEMGCRPVMF